MLDFGFWVNFRQEDRICRMNGILDVRFWIMDYGLRRSSCGGLLVTGGADFGFWMVDWGNSEYDVEGELKTSQSAASSAASSAPSHSIIITSIGRMRLDET